MKRLFELINKNLEGTALHLLHKQKNSPFSIITISRERGSGGRPIAYLVAKKLKSPWKVYHKDIVDEIARETSLDNEVIAQLDEHQSNVIKETINTIFGKQILTMNAYYKHLLHILATIGMRGNAIIIGRGANFLFPNALKIRIISSMEDRIQAMVKYEHITPKEAK
jgi:cytidylate kinase